MQNFLLLLMLLFGNAIATMASNYGDVFNATRSDFRDESIYFIITTRFFDGDESNNVQCWDNQAANEDDPPWRGDFKGLIERLDYIKALGFTSVWITPIVENASGFDYHGYHAHDFSKVDHRYESKGVGFQEVIDAAHEKGMKIILDIVLNHTGNFGEANLFKLFTRDTTMTKQADINACMIPFTKKDGGKLPDNYLNDESKQHGHRIALLKNEGGNNHDSKNVYHHIANEWNWDDYSRWYGQIAGDCVDLNTENPYVSNYLVKCYGKFIEMGVDGFRIDTSGHISRLTFNKAFIPQFTALAEKHKAKRNGGAFFMFGEVCARANQVTYRGHENCSPYFYTWKESKEYAWNDDETSWDGIYVKNAEWGTHPNMVSTQQQGKDYNDDQGMPTSDNHALNGNNYHTPNYGKYSGFSVIDFPMHWNFKNASNALQVIGDDKLYNDATYNVVYVDSHDYSPDGQSDLRFPYDQATWAENASLMFTFRGIPCIYYGSEIEFRKGVKIDPGGGALTNSGRAYYGGYITGDVKANDFALYTASGNVNATLKNPLALHFQRLNQIRMAVPALRKGQYSTNNCEASNGAIGFKRRYTDKNTDSFVLVTISGNTKFKGLPEGTYVDVVTGDTKTISEGGTLEAKCSGKGNLRAYVLQTKGAISSKVGTDGKYLYGSSSVTTPQPEYDGKEEAGTTGISGGGSSSEPEVAIDPCVAKGEKAVFFKRPDGWGKTINLYIWSTTSPKQEPLGGWPGTAMENLGNGNYKITLNGDYSGYNFIFNAGGDNAKTGDLKGLKLSAMYDKDGTVVKTIAEGDCEAGEGAGDIPSDDPVKPDTPVGEQCVFFDNTQNWSQVYCYVWYNDANGNNVEECGKWPGSPCDLKEGNVYKYCFDKTIGKPNQWGLIFHNNVGNQTGNLVAKASTMYDFNGNETPVVGIEDVEALNVDVYSYNRVIYVQNAEGRIITVRGLDGCVIYSGIDTAIAVNNAGVYLVTVEDSTLKIMVK